LGHIQPVAIGDYGCYSGGAQGKIDRPQPACPIGRINQKRSLQEIAIASSIANQSVRMGPAAATDPNNSPAVFIPRACSQMNKNPHRRMPVD
jgi:hypothetical protein